jgi:hypothetical protein
MITDAMFEAWLKDSTAQRVTLYEADALSGEDEVTRRISNRAYVGDPAAPYVHAVSKDVVVVDAITRDGGARLSTDQIGIWNVNGERDSWLDDVWTGREVRAFVGDIRWPVSDFRLKYVGVMKGVRGTDDGTQILIDLHDITERVNAPVSELTMADGSPWPHTFGEVPNITPKLKNAATGEYTFHPAQVEDVIEARVDAKPRTTITKHLATGSFTFQTAVGAGTPTADVQGDKTGGIYRKTIAALVRLLVTGYGKESERFTDAEIDGASFDAFEAAHPQAVGLHLDERTNVIEACHRLTKSVQAYLVPSRVGKLRLVQYGIPAAATASITPSQYVSLKRGDPHPVVAAVKIAYCRNYTQQTNLQTSIPLAHKEMFSKEWRTVTAVDLATRDRYKLSTDPVQIETCLLNAEDAEIEAERRLTQDKVPRVPYMIEGEPVTMLLQLGQGVTVYGDRYGMAAGKLGQITLTSLDLGTYRTLIEVTV